MSEREEKFERMLQDVQADYQRTVSEMERLKGQDKTKTATYRQLFANKLTLQNLLALYRTYGLLD